jgi:hypothetical protein
MKNTLCHLDELTDVQRLILLHTLGFQKVGGRWKEGGWRNHFSTDPGCDNNKPLLDLVNRGWMVVGRIENGVATLFHASEEAVALLKSLGWPWAKG